MTSPDFIDVLEQRGIDLAGEKSYSEARKIFEQVLSFRAIPLHKAKVLTNIMLSYREEGNLDDAIRTCQEILQISDLMDTFDGTFLHGQITAELQHLQHQQSRIKIPNTTTDVQKINGSSNSKLKSCLFLVIIVLVIPSVLILGRIYFRDFFTSNTIGNDELVWIWDKLRQFIYTNFLAIFFLIVGLIQWFSTVRAYGYLPIQPMWQMILLIRKTIKFIPFIGSIIAIASGFGSIFLPDYFPNFPFVYTLSLGFFVFTYFCLPPTIFLLGSSIRKEENGALYYQIMWECMPLKLIHMIDDFDQVKGSFRFNVFHREPLDTLGNYYALPKISWQNQVHLLMNIVPIIVVDVRIATNSIKEEVQMVLASEALLKKSIFIVSPHGENSILKKVQADLGSLSHPLNIATSENIVSVLRNLKKRFLSPI